MSTNQETSERRGQIVVETFGSLGVECSLSGVVEGPQIIRYELAPGRGTKMRDYRRLDRADDLAAALEAESVRITAPIPGTGRVGVEVARTDRQVVGFDDLPRAHYPPTVAIGADTENRAVLLPLRHAPHCLVAGQTGSGKTVMLHTIITTLAAGLTPEQVRLCLIDPKRTEFGVYEGLPHLLSPVADDPQKAVMQLQALVLNMEDRFKLFQALGARDIEQANASLVDRGVPALPYFMCVVDEFAELILTSHKEVEALVIRLAQKARAVGIHLIVATQYPKADILSGLIRVNLPTKICFAVPDQIASRVVLDRPGAEKLLGMGDGLFSLAGLPATRFQSAWCSPGRVSEVVERWGPAPMREAATVE